MSEILASVLSSGVVAAVITKLSNDHDRKKKLSYRRDAGKKK